MKYIIDKKEVTACPKKRKKNLTEFDHYLIHAAIEQYDQKKYDSVTVDTLTKYAPYDVSAAWRVADVYQFGRGDFKQDYEKANHWLQIAADMNDPWSQFCLAVNYHFGQGTEKNYEKAFSLYSKAVSQG